MVSQVAERYGQALFELALETNSLELWQNQAKDVIDVFRSNPELEGFFKAVKISTLDKKELINKIFNGKIDRTLVNFLNLLMDKKRIGNTAEILQCFITLGNEYLGIENGTVVSARKLTRAQINEVEEAMSKRRGQKVELVNKIDTRLISGIKVVIGNEVIDGSMKSKIDTLKNELLKESR